MFFESGCPGIFLPYFLEYFYCFGNTLGAYDFKKLFFCWYLGLCPSSESEEDTANNSDKFKFTFFIIVIFKIYSVNNNIINNFIKKWDKVELEKLYNSLKKELINDEMPCH